MDSTLRIQYCVLVGVISGAEAYEFPDEGRFSTVCPARNENGASVESDHTRMDEYPPRRHFCHVLTNAGAESIEQHINLDILQAKLAIPKEGQSATRSCANGEDRLWAPIGRLPFRRQDALNCCQEFRLVRSYFNDYSE